MLGKVTDYIRLLRLDKPVGIFLVFVPAAVGVLMAQPAPPPNGLLILMFIGAVLARSAGCIINDITDKDFDAQVERTKNRPIAAGKISVKEALVALFIIGFAALMILAFLPARVLSIVALAIPMIIAYPWMKRITWWPQLFLGLTFNLGTWVGWAATGAPFTASTVLLYGAFVCWTLGYDTIYAVQDAEDDRKAGVKSTALRLGRDVARFVAGWYAITLLCLIFSGLLSNTGPIYLLGIVLVALHMRWQMHELPFAGAEYTAGKLFRSNQWLGLALFCGIYFDRFLSVWPLLTPATN